MQQDSSNQAAMTLKDRSEMQIKEDSFIVSSSTLCATLVLQLTSVPFQAMDNWLQQPVKINLVLLKRDTFVIWFKVQTKAPHCNKGDINPPLHQAYKYKCTHKYKNQRTVV